jgi:hypothetical protein
MGRPAFWAAALGSSGAAQLAGALGAVLGAVLDGVLGWVGVAPAWLLLHPVSRTSAAMIAAMTAKTARRRATGVEAWMGISFRSVEAAVDREYCAEAVTAPAGVRRTVLFERTQSPERSRQRDRYPGRPG